MHLTGANTIALAYHGLVDGALGGDEEAGAGDEGEDLLPGQLRDESLPNSLARAQMSPVANPRQLGQVPEMLRIQEYW